MKTITTSFIILICSVNCIAQTKAITDYGEEVILFEDGSWKYANDNNQTRKYIYENMRPYKRSARSTFLLKSKKTNLGIWLNPKKWSFVKAEANPDAEYELQLKGEDAYGVLITERIEIPIENLKSIAITNALSVMPDIQIVNEEYRIVNNIKILMLQMEGTMLGMKVIYYGYYFSNNSGTNQLLVYTAQSLFEDYKKDLTDLLNGMVELK